MLEGLQIDDDEQMDGYPQQQDIDFYNNLKQVVAQGSGDNIEPDIIGDESDRVMRIDDFDDMQNHKGLGNLEF